MVAKPTPKTKNPLTNIKPAEKPKPKSTPPKGGPQESATSKARAATQKPEPVGKGAGTGAGPYAKATPDSMKRFVDAVSKKEGPEGLTKLVQTAMKTAGKEAPAILKGILGGTAIGAALGTVISHLVGAPVAGASIGMSMGKGPGENQDDATNAIAAGQSDPNFVGSSGAVPPEEPTSETMFGGPAGGSMGSGSIDPMSVGSSVPEGSAGNEMPSQMPPQAPTMPVQPQPSPQASGVPGSPPPPSSGPPAAPQSPVPQQPPQAQAGASPGGPPTPQSGSGSAPPPQGPTPPAPGQQSLSNPYDQNAGVQLQGGNPQYPTFAANSMDALDFRQAFAQARRTQGPNAVFQWHGRMYTTKIKGER